MFNFLRFWKRAPKSSAGRTSNPPTRKLGIEVLEDRCLMTVSIGDFAIPSGNSMPVAIALGRDGNLWFTESQANKIARINPISHVITEFAVPTTASSPAGIAVDRVGNVWFTELNGNNIGVLNVQSHVITEFAIPTAGSQPYGITLGSDGNLWFTEVAANQIGCINPITGTISEFGITTPRSMPAGITSGADGNIWFTEYNGNKLGVLNTASLAIAEVNLPTANSQPFGISVGVDGNVWFAEYNHNRIGKFDPITATITEFRPPTTGSGPFGITAGPDGKVWFTEAINSAIGRFDPVTQTFLELPIPSSTNAQAYSIVTGADGNLWFTEYGAGKVGQVVVPPTIYLNPQSRMIGPGQSVTFTAAASGAPLPTTPNVALPNQWGWVNAPSPALVGVQWEVSIDGGLNYVPISNGPVFAGANVTLAGDPVYSGVNTNVLTITGATTAMSGYKYLAVFSNGLITSAANLAVVTPLSITPTLPNGLINVPCIQTITVTGATAPFSTFSVTNFNAGGTGLSASQFTITPATGTITLHGTPTATGTVTFTVAAATTAGASVLVNYRFKILAPLSITTNLATGIAKVKYNQTIKVTGGALPYATFAVNNFNPGTTGLTASAFTINAAKGTIAIRGTPTLAGTATFVVDVIDSDGNTLTQQFALTVVPPLAATPSLPTGTVSANYNQTISVTGGAAPYASMSITGFKPGATGLTSGAFTVDTNTGTVAIQSTPTGAGTATFTLTVIDAIGAKLVKNYSLVINSVPAFGALTKSAWTVNQSGFNGTFAIAGGVGPFTITNSTGLPIGLTAVVNGRSIGFAGTPSSAGPFGSGSITIQDANGVSATANFGIVINNAPTIGTLGQTDWTKGKSGFTGTLAISDGTGPYTIIARSGIPTGMGVKIVGQTVTFTGTPTVAKTFIGTITIRDASGATAQQNFSITINPAITLGALNQTVWSVGQAGYPGTITINGGTGAYTLASATGLPTGMSASVIGSTITFNGTPTVAKTFVSRVTVQDAVGATAGRTFTIKITLTGPTNPSPTLNPIGAQAMAHGQTSLNLTVNAYDLNNDPLTFQATAQKPSALAYLLKQQYGFHVASGTFYTNMLGYGEKWLGGNNGSWFFLLPSGQLYRWSFGLGPVLSSANLLATFDPRYYEHPELLWNARPSVTPPITLSFVGNQLTIQRPANLIGTFFIDVTVSDGTTTVKQSFTLTLA